MQSPLEAGKNRRDSYVSGKVDLCLSGTWDVISHPGTTLAL